MGTITIMQADNLFWLGRYTERVYTTLHEFFIGFDKMIDEEKDSYEEFCQRINIPNIYSSKEDFLESYPFNKENPDSIITTLGRAYDNAIVLRDEITSEALSFIQLAIYEMEKAKSNRCPIIGLHTVSDNILAFWGCADDCMEDDVARNMIKVGKRIERLDLYLSFEMPVEIIEREYKKLLARINNTNYPYSNTDLENIAVNFRRGAYKDAVALVERLI